MAYFRAWEDGSSARLDIGPDGLGLALRSPDGRVAAVHLERSQPLGPVGRVRGLSRVRLTDGSLNDTVAVAEADDRGGEDEEVTVEDLGGGVTRVTIRRNGGAEHGGTTQVLEDDGQGKRSDLLLEADGTQTLTVSEPDDGETKFTKSITRPDGTSSMTRGTVSGDGLENSSTEHFVNGNPAGTSGTSQFHQGGEIIRRTFTTGTDGSTTSHSVTSHGDGTTTTVDSTTDAAGHVTSHTQQQEWPNGHITSVLNPDGTTTHTTTTHHSGPGALGMGESTDTVIVHTTDGNGHQVGDTHTTTTRTHEAANTKTVVETTHHVDGSKHVHTTEFDANGQVTSELDEFEPAPDLKVEPETTTTDGTSTSGGTTTNGGTTTTTTTTTGPVTTTTGPAPVTTTTLGVTPGSIVSGGTDHTTPTTPPGGTKGGIDITGEPCDPLEDPGCLAVTKKEQSDRSGPIGADIDDLQVLIESLSSGGDPAAVAAVVHNLAPAIFDLPRSATRGLTRGGSRLVLERDVSGDDDAWSDLDDPYRLVQSLEDLAAAARR